MNWYRRIGLLVLLSVFTLSGISAQNLVRMLNVPAVVSGDTLPSGFAGGLNLPQFGRIDLDGDGDKDLYLFDREAEISLTFLNEGGSSERKYRHAPQYESLFPTALDGFALLRDMDCDGLEDIVASNTSTLRIYHNDGSPGAPAFSLWISLVSSDYGLGQAPLFVSEADIPAVVDVDGDGDLDILTFDQSGTQMQWHRNLAVDSGDCATPLFMLQDECWGNFFEDGNTNEVLLNMSCRGGGVQGPLHSGSTIASFDAGGDGDQDLLIGDVLFNNLNFLRNDGSPQNAQIDSVDKVWPYYDFSVNMTIYPAAYVEDLNNDGLPDIAVAPNQKNSAVNYEGVWFYQNIGTVSFPEFSRVTPSFLQDEMIDVGISAYPVFFDADGDGLPDLLVGNYNKRTPSSSSSGIAYYRNTGTANAAAFTLQTEDYMNLSTVFSPQIFGISPAFGDMDNDQDEDMIFGDADGHLHYFENTAGPGNPASFVLAQQNYMGIQVGSFSAPFIIDIDRDGVKDLIVGEMNGSMNYFRNVGSANNALFTNTPTDDKWGFVDTDPVCCGGFSRPFIFSDVNGNYTLLTGTQDGPIYAYADFENAVGDTFPQTDANFGGIRAGLRSSIWGADIDGDGEMEWAVGNVRGGVTLYEDENFMHAPVADMEKHSWQLWPNPSEGAFRIRRDRPLPAGGELELTDLSGRVLHRQPLAAGQSAYEVKPPAGLPAGMYLVKLSPQGESTEVIRWMLLPR